MYVLVCIYFSLPCKRCKLRDVNKALIIGRRSTFFSFLNGGSTITSLVCLSICLFCYPYKKSLNLEKCHLCVCSTACSLCSMYVCTTRTVIYVVLCTLNLDPANDLVDLEKKEAAAESPISFFSWLFFFVKTLRHAHKTIWSQKKKRGTLIKMKRTLCLQWLVTYAMLLGLVYTCIVTYVQ